MTSTTNLHLRSQKKPRVLHAAGLLRPSSGMIQQMQWEQDAAIQLSIPWKSVILSSSDFGLSIDLRSSKFFYVFTGNLSAQLFKLVSWPVFRFKFYSWLASCQANFDIILLRYYVHDPFLVVFLFFCRKPVFLVHHTLEHVELALPGTPAALIRSTLDKAIAPIAIKKSSGIIGVTKEIVNYELRRASRVNCKTSFVYPNGVLSSQAEIVDRRSLDVPEILFVANFSPWHGLDLLIDQATAKSFDAIFHIVGPLNNCPITSRVSSNILLHGYLSHDKIISLAEKCWIGISSLALERKKMSTACPLKTRQYLSQGLPVYGSSNDVFLSDFPFYRMGSPDIQSMINFAVEMRKYSKNSVALMSTPLIDKKNLLSDMYRLLQESYR